jgi:hypothetical protein
VRVGRLRSGELIAGGAALALLIFTLALPWYRTRDPAGGGATAIAQDGWQALSVVRWVILATVAAGLLLVYLQATRRAPALPVTFSVIVTVLAVVCSILLIIGALVDSPAFGAHASTRVGAYLALASALVMVYGGYRSMREEGAPESGGIPVVRLGR